MHPVLLIDLAKHYGGAEVRVFDLAASLHGRRPYAVAALAGGPLHRRLEAAGLVSLPVPYARSDPRLVLFMLRAIRQGGVRVVDAHNPQSQFWGHLAALLAGAPVRISTVHSAYRFEHNGSLKGRAYEQVLRLNGWWGNHFITVSEVVSTYLRSIGIAAGQDHGPLVKHPLRHAVTAPARAGDAVDAERKLAAFRDRGLQVRIHSRPIEDIFIRILGLPSVLRPAVGDGFGQQRRIEGASFLPADPRIRQIAADLGRVDRRLAGHRRHGALRLGDGRPVRCGRILRDPGRLVP